MKKIFTVFSQTIFIMYSITSCYAQFVTIPDAKFAGWLTANIPAAMSGNQMDTTHPAVLSRTSINIENDSIYDLTGVQYFSSLKTLDCGNGIYTLTPNRLTSLPALPLTLDTLICGRNLLDSLPVLPPHLRLLKCYENPLHRLPILPDSLTYIECYSDLLTNLPALPGSLYFLHCGFNLLDSLPALPNTLQYLYCNSDSLTGLPQLPNPLVVLDCGNNPLKILPTLPPSLSWLSCEQDELANVPALPTPLNYLNCNNNFIKNLPALPGGLQNLYCGNNLLTSIPSLPNSLTYLYCDNNYISALPSLPAALQLLSCGQNTLLSLPVLPTALSGLYCQNNNIACFPLFPVSILNLSLYNNPFNCIPNYIPHMDSVTLTIPLCLPGNSNGCPPAQGIVGFTYRDNNSNCLKDAGDGGLRNIPVQLYDNANNFLEKTFTALNGVYDFPQPAGTYTVAIDTAGMPFTSSCPNPGLDSVVSTTLLDTNVNFSLACKPGFDVGVQSVSNQCGLIFPGLQHQLDVMAGDMTRWYNLNCAAGISGQVQISVTGNVNYVGPAVGALTPSVLGNVYTYTIADFGTVNNSLDFNLLFQTMTSAQAGDMICVIVTVTPTAGDNNLSNNVSSYCYYVSNSHDPNVKEVYPVNVRSGYQDWFTYTVHFQNTGNAAARNIRIADTIDTNLDMPTFEVINYSHKNTALLSGNVLTVSFPDINLSDSTSNLAGSIGFVQYRIKPKANRLIGTKIYNKAYIYFDYNVPIITNNVESIYVDGLATALTDIKDGSGILIFPNPASDLINVKYDAKSAQAEFEIIDLMGRSLFTEQPINYQINISKLPQGLYLLKVTDGDRHFAKRFVKE